jgi:Bacterial protein of unknown function (DUF937)
MKGRSTMSLVSEIMRYATPLLVERIAAAVGVNSSIARMALTYAVPAILGAFAGKASTPAGASALLGAVQKSDPNILGSLENVLGGAGKDQFIKNGGSALSSLLGQGGVDSIIGSLTKNAGIGSGAAAALLPIVGQMAMGGLAKSAGGLDATGLANMLASQKSSFDAAIPSAVSGPARTATSAVPQAAGGMGLAKWLIPLAAVLAGAWYFMSGPTQQMAPTEQAKPAATTAAPTGAIVVDGVDVTGTLTKTMGDLTGTFAGITDAASATAALPKFEAAGKAVDSLTAVAGKLDAGQKTAVGALISSALPALRATADKVLATQGVGEIAKPVVDALFAKIEALGK